jgi:hypothetical protein
MTIQKADRSDNESLVSPSVDVAGVMSRSGGRIRDGLWLLLACLAMPFPGKAQVPLRILGVADKQISADAVSFRVPVSSGYAYAVTLDGRRVSADLNIAVTNADYHELSVSRTNMADGAVTNQLVRFIVRSSERKDAEWGLAPWVPYPVVNAAAAELSGAHLRLLLPQDYPLGMEIPVVAWIENAQNKAVRANALLKAEGHPTIQLRRGAGSGFLAATNAPGPLAYAAQIPGVQALKTVNLEAETTWSGVAGVLKGTVTWPPHSRIAVTNHLTISAGSRLLIGEGSIVKLSRGVNITNDGALFINGTEDRPVVFAPVSRSQPWGGFFMRKSTGSIDANGAIFVASGADPNGGAGHKSQQCLFFLDNRPRLALTNCAAFDLAGQFGHATGVSTNAADPNWTSVNIVRTLIQRCVTGGEWNGCNLKLLDSALLETPYATPVFADQDEDGIYFTYGEFVVRDTVIGLTRDDGIDSGSDNGGSVTASNVWIESTFHEAFAWSGGGGSSGTRRTTNDHCVVINCGQGFECGWSRGGVSYSPSVLVTQSLAIGNGTGARFGDNYDWSYYGFLSLSQSILLNNYRDVWGFNWQTDAGGWIYRESGMDIQNNLLTAPNPHHPNNAVWNPPADGWRLAEFMTTPPDASVGVAFVTWTNQLDMSAIFKGTPVGLSSFTTNTVGVDYSFEDATGTIARGTLTFAPGETIKRIYPSGFNVAGKSLVRLVLRNPVNGDLTGETAVDFQGTVPAPRAAFLADGSQMDLARLGEGAAVALTAPSSETVRIAYRWEMPGQSLGGDTLAFAPGQRLQWIVPPSTVPQDMNLLRLTVSGSEGAPWDGPTHFYLVKTVAASEPSGIVLLPRGALWKYDDTVTNAVPDWFGIHFNDSSWRQGLAPLGYASGETTPIGYGPDSSHKYITTYFRKEFNVTQASGFESLTFNLLRDDGAIAYLNGAEIFRINMPSGAATINTTASTNFGGAALLFDSTASLPVLLQDGTNVAAVEMHQNNGGSSDIVFDLEIIGNPPATPEALPQLYWGKFDPGSLVFAWSDPAWILDQAGEVAGPYTASGLASPVTLTTTNRQIFYRLRK